MSKIYSRKRFIIKPKSKTRKVPAKIKSQTTKTIIILCVAIIIYNLIVSYIEPVFETLCEEKVRAVATIISNQESTKVMNKYQYEELYTIEKDENGNIVLIESNVVPINNMISDLTEGIQNRFSELTGSEQELIAMVVSTFGMYSGKTLERITHKETPWLEARENCMPEEHSNQVISKEAIKGYFTKVSEQYDMQTEEGIRGYITSKL